MNPTIRRIVLVLAVVVGGFLTIRLMNFLMVWSLYSWFFQTIRSASGMPDTLNGAFSIWFVAITLMLLPTFFSVLFFKSSPRKVMTIAAAVSAWLVLVYFMSLPQEGRFFNPMTGQAMYRYARTSDGKIDLFPLGYNFHPRYGTKLELVTPEVVKEIDLKTAEAIAEQEREKERQKQVAEVALQLVQKEQELVQQRAQVLRQEEGLRIQATQASLRKKQKLAQLVHVDRSVQLIKYPSWVVKVVHTELETTGPAEFDVDTLEQWLHPNQMAKDKYVFSSWTGLAGRNMIYVRLKESGMIVNSLGFRDLEAIQARGGQFFRQHFGRKHLYAWKSVVENKEGYLYVPYLVGYDSFVILDWGWVDNIHGQWDENVVALLFKK